MKYRIIMTHSLGGSYGYCAQKYYDSWWTPLRGWRFINKQVRPSQCDAQLDINKDKMPDGVVVYEES